MLQRLRLWKDNRALRRKRERKVEMLNSILSPKSRYACQLFLVAPGTWQIPYWKAKLICKIEESMTKGAQCIVTRLRMPCRSDVLGYHLFYLQGRLLYQEEWKAGWKDGETMILVSPSSEKIDVRSELQPV